MPPWSIFSRKADKADLKSDIYPCPQPLKCSVQLCCFFAGRSETACPIYQMLHSMAFRSQVLLKKKADYMVIKWNFLLVFLVLKLMHIFFVLGIVQQTVSSFASCLTVRCWFCLNYRWKRKRRGIYHARNYHKASTPT